MYVDVGFYLIKWWCLFHINAIYHYKDLNLFKLNYVITLKSFPETNQYYALKVVSCSRKQLDSLMDSELTTNPLPVRPPHHTCIEIYSLIKPCRPLGPQRVPESGIRKIGMFRHIFAIFWNPSVSFLNTYGNLMGPAGQVMIKNFGIQILSFKNSEAEGLI